MLYQEFLTYHHFRLDASEPGTVFAKEYEDTEEIQYKIALGDDFLDTVHELPSIITPPGMSVDRQQYLFDNIRQFCATEEAANLTCPGLTTDECVRGRGKSKICHLLNVRRQIHREIAAIAMNLAIQRLYVEKSPAQNFSSNSSSYFIVTV